MRFSPKSKWLNLIMAAFIALPVAVVATPMAMAHTISVVAAESSYASMVRYIGGEHVKVSALLDSPDVNPRQFKGSPRIGRRLNNADLVVMNGLGFDGWMVPLLRGTSNPDRKVIKASQAASGIVMPDKNWHLFYSPQAMLATASRVAAVLSQIDPAHKHDYQTNLQRFQKQLLPIYGQAQSLIASHPDLTVTATVPVYNYMLELLGYDIRYRKIQFASMRNSQPSAQQVKQFLQALQQHKVDLLIYNKQVHNRLTQNEVHTAEQAGIPTVGVSAIPLHGENYAQWQITQLKAIKQALAHATGGS